MMNMDKDIYIFASDEIQLTFLREWIPHKDAVGRVVLRTGRIQGNTGAVKWLITVMQWLGTTLLKLKVLCHVSRRIIV